MQILSTAAPDEEAVGEGGVEPPEVLFVGGSGAPATQGVRASEPTLADVEKVLAAIDVEMGRPMVGSDAAIPAAVQAVEVAEATFGRRRFAVDSAQVVWLPVWLGWASGRRRPTLRVPRWLACVGFAWRAFWREERTNTQNTTKKQHKDTWKEKTKGRRSVVKETTPEKATAVVLCKTRSGPTVTLSPP